ncbi:hypothetical protein KI688_003591 [Linnemannia hyalina]|uniref:Uncharacterized protein n=1 Tax=Linnemannia hyalina TaxID=64524 RepID=A0A9P8BQP2_9FUNG|nr:hypothetical protein KI688_003591 [Linnemannia hyalina]
MARSTTLLLLTILLLTTFLPILNHHIHVLAVPVPIPVPIIPTTTDEPALAVEHPNPSTIERRQLLGGLLGGLPSFRNEGGNAVQGGGSEQPVTGGVVPGWNNVNIGGR